MAYEFPRRTPELTKRILKETLTDLHSIIGRNLLGIYLYGSLAMGCYQPRTSDIDLIFITKEKMTKEDQKSILEHLKKTCSKDRRIELSIIDLGVVQNPRYPMLVNLHYEYWGNVFENEEDKEILSNLYTTKKRGFRVWGAPIEDVFSSIPTRYHVKSIIEDILHTRRYIHDGPERIGYDVTVYWILGSCRILAFIKEEKVLSKLEGGQWGLSNLPNEFHSLIKQAILCHRGKKREKPVWDYRELETFADYMTRTILTERRTRERKYSA
jgi:predicted nucleotidyltransferase